MKTIHEVKVPFSCRFRRWLRGAEGPVDVEADDPICIVERYVPIGETTNIPAGAKGRLHIEKWIKEWDELLTGTTVALVHKEIPVQGSHIEGKFP